MLFIVTTQRVFGQEASFPVGGGVSGFPQIRVWNERGSSKFIEQVIARSYTPSLRQS